MLFNTVIDFDTSTRMTRNISTSNLCLLLIPLLFMINDTLRVIARINAQSNIFIPNTTVVIEISMAHADIPSGSMNTGINPCRTIVTTITIIVVVTITTITMIASNRYYHHYQY